MICSVSEKTNDAIGNVYNLWYEHGQPAIVRIITWARKMFEVLESVKRVAKGSQWVSIDRAALNRFSHKLFSRDTEIPPWEDQYHFTGTRQETLAYLLVLDSINFCFWPAPGKAKWEIQYGTERLSGYYAMPGISLKE